MNSLIRFLGQNFYALAVGVLIVLCAVLRLYKIDSPVGDWHSWRQADTAAVGRNFIKFGFDPLRPRYDDLSNIQSGKDNPNGWRMVEFPIYQSLGYWLHVAVPAVAIEIWLRLVTIAAAVGTGILLYKLVARITDKITGLAAFFIYTVLPYSVYYGRTILPETSMVFFSLLCLYLLLIPVGNKNLRWLLVLLSSGSAALALLMKPTAVFLLIPVPYLLWRTRKNVQSVLAEAFVFFVLSILPILLWRQWILRFPEGIPAYDWLFNKDNIRFKGAWFYWLFADRIGRLMAGYWGLIFLGVGLIARIKKSEMGLFRLLGLGCLLYFTVIAGGNVQHDYYQVLVLPTLAVYMAIGLVSIMKSPAYSRPSAYLLCCTVIFFMTSFSWYTIRSYYWINRQDLLEAGRAADAILPPDAKVIAPNNGDTTFLYFINRQGWPQGFDIDKKIAMGATHYVTVSVADSDFETRDLAHRYKVLAKTGTYIIIQLK